MLALRHAPQDRFVSIHGLRLHYLDWGKAGAPVFFLLHGFSNNAHAFDQTADALCERLHVVAPDHRGHGDSAWAPDGYDLHKFVRDFGALARHVGVRPFLLLGHSMGGMVAIEYAARHPKDVERLVIGDIGPNTVREGIARIRRQIREGPEEFDSVDQVYALMRAQDPVPPEDALRHRAEHAVKRLSTGKWAWKYDTVLRSPERPIRRSAPPAVQWEMLAAIRCPTLVVRGERSDVLSRETARRMVKTLPAGRLAEVPGAGHGVPQDNFQGFLKALQEFLGA